MFMKHYANRSSKGLMVIESNWKPWYISPNFIYFIFFKWPDYTDFYILQMCT